MFIKGKKIDYLEFGVWYGGTLKKWLELNKNPGSRFYGFDTFEGLPEHWDGFTKKAPAHSFSTHGIIPEFNDKRVRLIKGLFQETADRFLSDFHASGDMRVLHVDSDLYSSALFVLTRFNAVITPGTIIVFDEFNSILDEFKAFSEYVNSYRKSYRVLAYSGSFYDHVAIEIL